jgi:hypothetical protein
MGETAWEDVLPVFVAGVCSFRDVRGLSWRDEVAGAGSGLSEIERGSVLTRRLCVAEEGMLRRQLGPAVCLNISWGPRSIGPGMILFSPNNSPLPLVLTTWFC